MARRTATPPPPDVPERIVDIDVSAEMQGSFLEYAYSVIYSRALPDARDGLKPVQRRILYTMTEMGLRPDRPYAKCARVVGEVMGKLHPHGDSAIYDALVRMAQPFSLRLPLVDGHGNFGSLDDGPAAYRYTECRLATAATPMTVSLDEDVVDFVANYDGQEHEPTVLPAAIPNLLVNGASGIAVGMATNMAPHNLGEVVAAARYLLAHPGASLEKLMTFVPGPDLPTGGRIVGLDGIREAYATGRGTFRTRATTRIEDITPRRKGIVVTELPYTVGPEKVTEKIKDLVKGGKLQGIHDVTDLTDYDKGLHLVIEIKAGFNPDAVLEHLFRLTPMQDSFGINNVALVEGQPKTLGLKELLQVYLDHRLDVVRRRSEFRRRRAQERLHLVEGLLIAILDIDEVIALIRSSEDASEARSRMMSVFDLSEMQANYILDMPLRRLTKFSKLELDTEQAELLERIIDLSDILDNPERLRAVVSAELAEAAADLATPRRTVLLEAGETVAAAVPLEVTDDPCLVVLTASGMIARTDDAAAVGAGGSDLGIVSVVPARTRGHVGVVTSAGRVHRVSALELPALHTGATPHPTAEFLTLPEDERVISLTCLLPEGRVIALGTRRGIVKRVAPDVPNKGDDWEIIRLDDGDEVVGCADVGKDPVELVFVTAAAQLLHFSSDLVRPQGRPAGGMAGIRLDEGDKAIFFGVVPTAPTGRQPSPGGVPTVVTVAGSSSRLPGTNGSSVKVSAFSEFPAKGRATGGVRAHRFVRGEDCLVLAWVGVGPARAFTSVGKNVVLPDDLGRRDGPGSTLGRQIALITGAPPLP